MKYLLIINDPPYGTERAYNALRLARSLAKLEGTAISIFLFGDAAACALAGQTTPAGYYNLQRMLEGLSALGAAIGVYGTCMDARGIAANRLVEGARRSSMDELTAWTEQADKVLIF